VSFLFCQLANLRLIFSVTSFSALAKNGSFGFAKGRLVCRAKPNVPFVGGNKIELKKCAVGKIKNTEG